MHTKLLRLFLIIFFLAKLSPSFAQLTVTASNSTSNSLQNIVQSLVGAGVTVSNITSNQFVFSDVYGTFNEPSGNFGITSGLLMTTGSIYNTPGPNNLSGASTGINSAIIPDLDLENLAKSPGQTEIPNLYDVCIIEFDFSIQTSVISFNYVFASEEYQEYVGSQFNDVFGFFLSGPGIIGKRNLATIPLTTIPVAINNVNHTSNTSYYVSNGDGLSGGGTILQYDGYTTKLTAIANVQPCQTYHIKLAIADVGDNALDSGVFLEAGSLSASGEGIYIGDILAPDSLHICITELPITLKAGIDVAAGYTWYQDNTLLPVVTQTLPVSTTGIYKTIVQIGTNCTWVDSIEINIDEDFDILAIADTTICYGESVPLDVAINGPSSSHYKFEWLLANYLTNNLVKNPVSTPDFSVSYRLRVDLGKCTAYDTVNITVLRPIILVVPSAINGCIGESIQLFATGAENYSWTPAGLLDNPFVANPSATIVTPTVFTVTGYNDCYSDQKNILVTPYAKPTEQAYGDTSICFGGTAYLRSDPNPNYTYTWIPSTGLSSNTVYNPVATPVTSQTYILSINNNGCIKYDSVQVDVGQDVKAQIFLPKRYSKVPWNVKLRNFSVGATQYVWYVTSLDSLTEAEPTFTITKEGFYNVVLKAINSIGCFDYDTVQLKAYDLFIPNLITPNGDGHNDAFVITGIGEGFSLEVYNRWGDRVYKNKAYRNEWRGEGLSDDVYYFEIKDKFTEEVYKGWVQITR